MRASQLETLRWQFDLCWKLAEVHLPALTDELCLWEPASGSWTVRRSVEGDWRPDWSEPEPDPAPPVTVGWLTWQIVWWWSGVQAAARGEVPAGPHEVAWPGSAGGVVDRIRSLSAEWLELLSTLRDKDLERPLAYPWPAPRPLRLAIAWTNVELMKNVAEIGYVRHLFSAFNTLRA